MIKCVTDNKWASKWTSSLFWKYYLGKTGSQWPPAGFNDLTFQSTSSQPCVVCCPRAAGMKSRGGASKICSDLTVNIRELLDCTDFFNCVWDLIQNNFNDLTDRCLHDWFGWCQQGFSFCLELTVDGYFTTFPSTITKDLIFSRVSSGLSQIVDHPRVVWFSEIHVNFYYLKLGC